jgi:hypothetical protein
MMDQRKHPRVPFFGTAKISTEAKPIEVTVSNMSLGGVLLHSNKPFELGKEITVQINGTYRGKTFQEKVFGRIVAVHRGPVGNSYGLQFGIYLDSERQPCLFAWVNRSKKKAITSFLRDSS